MLPLNGVKKMLKEFKTETEDRQDFGEKDPIGEDKDEEEDE